MKITKTRLKEIIKEEVVKIFEAKHKDEEVSGVKVVEEEEELEEEINDIRGPLEKC